MPYLSLAGCHLQELLLQEGVVPGIGSVSGPGLEGPVHTAHGEANDVQHVDGAQHAEVGPPEPLPLEAHQLLHRRLVQNMAGLQKQDRTVSPRASPPPFPGPEL